MGPNWTNNQDSVTFYPTCHNEAEVKEDHEEAIKEIERLENMLYEQAIHKDNKHILQHKQVKHARLAKTKHKKPHLTRRII